ncbi:hypothetical protein TNCT_309761 [Trichonephila clavata]|uniref:Uncharacterized protein n=1 Tax=Trichonephila clavata TaxID=2740835 RepID=A0A8X6FQ50_TRICU|nr:hypothetical protein TNCT_309761 [Trichonephila clavata]
MKTNRPNWPINFSQLSKAAMMPREANEADAPKKEKSASYKHRNLNEGTVHQEERRQKKGAKACRCFFCGRGGRQDRSRHKNRVSLQ